MNHPKISFIEHDPIELCYVIYYDTMMDEYNMAMMKSLIEYISDDGRTDEITIGSE